MKKFKERLILKTLFMSVLTLFPYCSFCEMVPIHNHGYWMGEEARKLHQCDESLAKALIVFFKAEGAKSIVDFGCGTGDYIRYLQENNFECEGYDGNPSNPSHF